MYHQSLTGGTLLTNLYNDGIDEDDFKTIEYVSNEKKRFVYTLLNYLTLDHHFCTLEKKNKDYV